MEADIDVEFEGSVGQHLDSPANLAARCKPSLRMLKFHALGPLLPCLPTVPRHPGGAAQCALWCTDGVQPPFPSRGISRRRSARARSYAVAASEAHTLVSLRTWRSSDKVAFAGTFMRQTQAVA